MSEQNNGNNGRRDFMKKGGLTLAAAIVGAKFFRPSSVQAQGAKAGGQKSLEMVKVTDPMAQALGYIEDASKVDTKKWPKRAGKEGAKQFCYNCQFYKVDSGDPKTVKAAPCTLFANKGVAGMGWCNSWTLNPKVKG